MSQNWLDLFVLTYAIATGFVASGIISSFYQMVTTKQAKFGLFGSSFLAWVLTFFFFALTGPFIVVRSGIRSYWVDKQPLRWLVASVLVAALWSGCSGLVVLSMALSARSGLV